MEALRETRIAEIKSFTMESETRIGCFHDILTQCFTENIPGDIVECGVWRGGMMMLAAKLAQAYGQDNRKLWLFDTFTGMSEPGSHDVAFNGEVAHDKWERMNRGAVVDWCLSPLEEVKRNIAGTNYRPELVQYVAGDVLQTLRYSKPEEIAVLRLDTDWYESTKMELHQLFPLLSEGGFLIIADYSDWQGARKAAEEYFTSVGGITGIVVDGTFVSRKS